MRTAKPQRHAMFDSVGWKRSTRCGPDGGNCVEVNRSTTNRVGVRDSADVPHLAVRVLTFGPPQWRHFLDAARTGEYDH
jgi:hypothetical protein